MSKFRTRLRNVGRPTAGLGFAASARQSRPRHVLVIAEVPNAAAAAEAAAAGVDAVVVRGAPSALAGFDHRGHVLAGIWLEDATGAEVAAARDAGADFFLFDDGRAQAGTLVPTEIGRVLLLGADQDTERLRSVAAIDLDAVVVAGEVGATTVRDQLALRRVAGLTGAPLLIAVAGTPDAATLEAWRDAGAPAVLVTGSAAELRAAVQAAEAVPAPHRSEDRGTPLIGALRAANEHHHDDDDDGDDF